MSKKLQLTDLKKKKDYHKKRVKYYQEKIKILEQESSIIGFKLSKK